MSFDKDVINACLNVLRNTSEECDWLINETRYGRMTQLIGKKFYGKRADREKAFLEVLISVETSSGDTVEKENNGRGLLGDNISILLVGRIVSDGFDFINNKVSESFGR